MKVNKEIKDIDKQENREVKRYVNIKIKAK